MSVTIEELALQLPEFPFSDNYFQIVVLGSYIETLIANANTLILNPNDTYVYEGDFYGILNSNEIDMKYWSIILRMNGFTDTTDYDTSITQILVPDYSTIDEIAMTYATTIDAPTSTILSLANYPYNPS